MTTLVRMTTPRRLNAAQATPMFPHTVTVYTTYTEKDDSYHETITNYITILRGVFLDAVKAVNVRESGLVGADAAELYIPFDVEAVDGLTGKAKKFAGPKDFWRSEDKSELWTLSDAGNTCFIKGEVVEADMDRQELEMAYDDVYSVTKVDEKDFGGLKHWEVGGA